MKKGLPETQPIGFRQPIPPAYFVCRVRAMGTHAAACHSKPCVPHKSYTACKGYLKTRHKRLPETRVPIFQVAFSQASAAGWALITHVAMRKGLPETSRFGFRQPIPPAYFVCRVRATGTHATACHSKPHKPYTARKGYLKTRIFIFQVACAADWHCHADSWQTMPSFGR